MGTPFAQAHLKPSEVCRLLNAPDQTPKGLRDRAMLELFYSSGIRREEMARLTVPAVDIRNGFVRVQGKGSKERIVPIGQSACEALARYLKEARAVWLKAPRNPGWTDALWLSPIQPHSPIQTQAVGLIVLRYGRQSLGRNVSPHVWRHSAPRTWWPMARTSSMCNGSWGTSGSRPPKFTPALPCPISNGHCNTPIHAPAV